MNKPLNQKQLAIQRNNIKRLFKHSSSIHTNCVRFNTNNTVAHEIKKAEICFELQEAGKTFISEGEFENGGGKCDICCLDEGICIELIHSESKKSIEKKRKKYPLPIKEVRI